VPKRVRRLAPLVLVLTALALLAACGDAENPADPPVTNAGTGTADPGPEDPTPGHGSTAGRKIAFLVGFEAGIAAAKDDDQLLFVYVGRHNPT